jgi:uncharacterized protein (TIGR03435 family)
MRTIITLLLFTSGCFGQTFAVASVKPSPRTVGKDARGQIAIGADRLSGRNVSLKGFIVAAYGLELFQVSGGPGWLDIDEFDIDARADGPASKEQLGMMLRALLTERFHLAAHQESKETRLYVLGVDKNGPKIHPIGRATGLPMGFRGDMRQLANLLSVQLSIPAIADPGRPSMASGAPVPVLDKTGLQGIYEFNIDFRPEVGVDMFLLWQRLLGDQAGLKLESQKAKTEFLVVDRAERIPVAN